MWQAILTPKAVRHLNKLKRKNETGLIQSFDRAIQDLQHDPFRGEPKGGDLKDLWGWEFNFKGVAYRIAYLIAREQLCVLIISLGSHEGFWQQAKDYWNKYKGEFQNP